MADLSHSSNGVLDQEAASHTEQRVLPKYPVVIGIYGVSGSGKTTLLDQLKLELGQKHFLFYEGSQVIDDLVPGGLAEFHKLDIKEKRPWREEAIDAIKKDCVHTGKAAVVTGHFSFFDEETGEVGLPVITSNDLATFTHILYLDVPQDVLAKRRIQDSNRHRPSISNAHLRQWQEGEKTELRRLCLQHGILFMNVASRPDLQSMVSKLLCDFRFHTEKSNLECAKAKLDAAIDNRPPLMMLVLDADKTLSAEDTGALFWERGHSSISLGLNESPLKGLFSSRLGYSYTAFRQATLLYEEAADDQEFDRICDEVASKVSMYPEFVCLLHRVAEQTHIGAVVVTCGIRRVWEKVLEREGLAKAVKVIGGGRIADGLVITPLVKGALVSRLQDKHDVNVWAFGDSPLDLDMLKKADKGIVVVGEEKTRSKSMDDALSNAIENECIRLSQVILPPTASIRLDATRLPLFNLAGSDFVDSIPFPSPPCIRVVHATDKSAAKLLMTQMRDSTVAGPYLCKAHCRVGKYLATEFLSDMIGLEEYPIPHVQGHHTSGHRLYHEEQTIIVAVMRAGEPMALGVWEAFPRASFLHATSPDDLKPGHVKGLINVVLVDSVINSGKTVVEFLRRIQSLHSTIRIVVVAGVVQDKCVSGRTLTQGLTHGANVSIVALRLSQNKYTGRGSTDTGNRLFNTTSLS
ncbi:hypothetical protein FQN49_005459 [Arthroderma sp. PD_2]|nr:hypothetical protein FQN49_005459 [Arthroderma sp. PD_2]